MADLDDFFAKKDRKKSKSVKKFATTDELAKKLEDSKQKPDARPKKERPVTEGEEGGRPEEEEWKEYEEPVKDYTGLKIQVLQGGNGAAESGRDSAGEETAPDGSGKTKGPWNKTGSEEQPTPPPPPPEEKPAPPPAPKTYQPPASRVRGPEPVRRNQAKHAPDIHNDDYFPQLGAAAKRGGGGGWSTAGGGGAGGAGATRHPPPPGARQGLALGNRFTSLQDDS